MSSDLGIKADRIEALTIALRKLAIIPTMAPGVQQVVHDGHRCRVCAATWSNNKPEHHADDCALKGTER